MTKFDELVDIITRNKNKNKAQQSEATEQENQELEVAGAESTKNPLITFGDQDTDPDLLDQLHLNPKYKPNQGYADRWDLDDDD